MALVTYKQFLDNIQALEITGVKKSYDGPPKSIPSANLPAKFPALPSGDESPLAFGGGVQFPAMTADMVVVYDTFQGNTPMYNLEETVKIMDNVAAALRGGQLNQRKNSFTMNVATVDIASVTYWAVVTTVTS